MSGVDIFPSSVMPSPDATMLATTTTPVDPLQRHLPLIVGVPTGIVLAVTGVLLCILYLMCSAYCENRKNKTESTINSSNVNTTVRTPSKYNLHPALPLNVDTYSLNQDTLIPQCPVESGHLPNVNGIRSPCCPNVNGIGIPFYYYLGVVCMPNQGEW